eukprot:TRINITY_DN35066_c0_g1_i1.p1 TRINITY_DN35066_c0_g1~~TRINITY_DN35066_c0_g1_i1.p1  ORF type:complete len:335 (-),score=109.50 TRINITY_DN35066_c0_g1_i1:368-1372(-)
MPDWVKIVENENDKEMELQVEADGLILLQNIRNVFPSATTLKYRNPENNAWRVIKCVDDVLHPPEDDGWRNHTYLVVVPKGQERRREISAEVEDTRNFGPVNKAIYVLFDSEDLTEGDLRDYFGEFGTITNINCIISKKFAFITFEDETVPFRLYGKPVSINGIALDIKEPESDEKEFRKLALIYKEDKITARQFREFFEQYGEVTDVYVTKPFRKYGFVTFTKPKVARDLYDQNVKIEGVKVFLTKPRPKMDKADKREFGGAGGRGGYHQMPAGRGRSEEMGWGGPSDGYGMGGGGMGFGANSMSWAQSGMGGMGNMRGGFGSMGGRPRHGDY